MRVASVSYSNFKGHTATFDLAPVTLITGANFSHKTTIPLAIRLGLAGHLPPPIGVRGIYALAGNPQGQGEMTINLIMDNGREVAWAWRRDASGKVTTEGGLSSDIAMPELMLDSRQFFARTAAEQTALVFQACSVGPEQFTPNMITLRLKEVHIPSVAILEKTLAEVSEYMATLKAASTPKWMAALVDWLKTQQKAARDDSKAASGAFQAFRGENATEYAPDVASALQAAKLALRELEGQQQADGLREQLELLKTRGKAYPPAQDLVRKLSKLKEFTNGTNLDLDEAGEELIALNTKVARHTSTVVRLNDRIEDLRKQIAAIEAAEDCPTCHTKGQKWKKNVTETLKGELAKHTGERDAAADITANMTGKASELKALVVATKDVAATEKQLREIEGFESMVNDIQSRISVRATEQADLPAKIQAQAKVVEELEAKQRVHELWANDRERKTALEQQLLASSHRADAFKQILDITLDVQEQVVTKAFAQVLKTAKYFTDGLLNSSLEFVDGRLGRRVSKADVVAGCQAPIDCWISFDAFSGTEEVLALAGFGVALCANSPVKIVVLDELGRLDHQRKLDVALRMLSLVEAKVIDQALLVDVDPKVYAALPSRLGFSTINL